MPTACAHQRGREYRGSAFSGGIASMEGVRIIAVVLWIADLYSNEQFNT